MAVVESASRISIGDRTTAEPTSEPSVPDPTTSRDSTGEATESGITTTAGASAATRTTAATGSATTELSATADGATTSDTAAPTDTAAATGTATETVAADLDRPSAADLAGQPSLGLEPGTAPTLVIAFEDPSCHNCRRFNQNTFPEIESELVEAGETTYVYRNYPYAFEWGKPAMQALEATYARDETAFWALKRHYFDTQEEFDGSNVLDRTREFLASETDLDTAAVVDDARNEVYDGAVQRDIDAGDTAGVVSTPTFYLFREGSFLTEIRGAQSYQVFAQALGVR